MWRQVLLWLVEIEHFRVHDSVSYNLLLPVFQSNSWNSAVMHKSNVVVNNTNTDIIQYYMNMYSA